MWQNFPFLNPELRRKNLVIHRSVWHHNGIPTACILCIVNATFNITQRYSNLFLITIAPSWMYKACEWMDPHHRQPTWYHWVSYLAHNNVLTTIWYYEIVHLYMLQGRTINFQYTPINSIRHMGVVTLLHRKIFQIVASSTTILNSIWHQDQNKVPM